MTLTNAKIKINTKTKIKIATSRTKSPTSMPKKVQHTPVLLDEVLQYLSPKAGDTYLDLTAGYGGHAQAVLLRTNASATLVDRDSKAHETLHALFNTSTDVTLLQKSFEEASIELAASKQNFDVILADLGISSPHIDNKDRGFSLKENGPLDMRMDQTQALDASTIVNTYSKEQLVSILRVYGEEPKAERIASLILDSRPVTSTNQLASIVARVWPGYSKVHPATRTFQAIRITVNDELGQLERCLPIWKDLLQPGGRLAIITFHSLEDRLVKQYFKENSGNRYDAPFELLTKKPVVASKDEIVHNPRSRSAKLRVVRRK